MELYSKSDWKGYESGILEGDPISHNFRYLDNPEPDMTKIDSFGEGGKSYAFYQVRLGNHFKNGNKLQF